MSIIWEDCGAFPYHYIPQKINGFDETIAFTNIISTLRGKEENFGACMKGLFALNWDTFEHQKGEFVIGRKLLGTCDEETRTEIWRCIQAYWLRNADKAYDMVKAIHTKTKDKTTTVYSLAEDGMDGKKIYYPAALFAAMLWNSDKDIKDLICETMLNQNVKFA